ncbi:DUF3251 domain-containing protein [Erwinia sp. HR93]|uniref:DUF3251 domain-containing protein n=1 Tax=Erwinia sp. HR93 TaxID=3094840 RepID=UPI002ADEEDEA|nr:DUF3251 domain-containing protein [Erwinia sp. HR93]MEA1063885.1 DUF3251 domain-containing protein [Erwinia sp. HR93]
MLKTPGIKLILASGLLTLTACSAPRTQVQETKEEVSALAQKMNRLNQQTVKLTQQNTLNAQSKQGVYLLPAAKAPAQLESQIGDLTLRLDNIIAYGTGTKATLTITGDSIRPLPAFSGEIVWGEIQGTIEDYREVNTHTRTISEAASVLVPSDIVIQLDMPDIAPAQLGFVRIHDIVPTDPDFKPAARSPFGKH